MDQKCRATEVPAAPSEEQVTEKEAHIRIKAKSRPES